MASREEAARRIWECRTDGCWQAVMDYCDIELDRLRLKLESVRAEEDFRKLQGRICELRQLRKVLCGSCKKSDGPE